MRIEFHGLKGGATFTTSVQVGTFRPMTPEEVEQQRREQERMRKERERREKARGVMLSVRAVGGGFWLEDGADAGMLSTTSMYGVEIRLQKGYGNGFAFEGDFIGGRIGEASFSGVPWQGMQGDVTRRGTFGQVMAAGVLRHGEKYMWSTRLGIGVQGSTYESAFTTGGTSMEGPGDSFEIGFIGSIGGTFTARLGEHWIMGAEVAFSQALKSEARALQGGIPVRLLLEFFQQVIWNIEEARTE